MWLAQSKSAPRTACDTLVRAMERTSEHVPATLPARIELAGSGTASVATAAGRALGEALRGLLEGDGVAGYGMAIMPADEALANVVLEASGRPLLVSNVDLSDAHVAGLERDLVSGFLRELAEAAGLTMHVRLLHGEDAGHVLDAIFKALGGALANAAAPSRKE